MSNDSKGNYAEVNGLNMYYESHGTGQPLVVLHGAYMTIDLMGETVPELAKTRQIIGVELQGHGCTADIDRPLSYELMADDVAALLGHIGIEQADLFGYSMGGGVALQVAIRHPEVVRKLALASATFNSGGYHPGVLAGIEQMTPEVFDGTPFRDQYDRIAPPPEDFPMLVAKLKELDGKVQDWLPEDIRSTEAPALLIIGNSDVIRPEHAVEMFRPLGGGVVGDLAGLPYSKLAVLPGTTHISLMERADWLLSMIGKFLDAAMPEAV
jgi:pimeloyl-ACP methyl ester carboxylesterase